MTGANLTGVNLTGIDLSGTSLVPSSPSVTGTNPAGVVVAWPAPPSLLGATPGSCTPSSGSTFPGGQTAVACQVVEGQGDVTTGTFIVTVMLFPPPATSVLVPSNGATVAGSQVLDASGSSPVGMASVNFGATGGTLSDQVIATGTLTYYGWVAQWNTTSVPNGTYTLQSVATDVDGTPKPATPSPLR